ncbi:MAG: beta-galactosidase [Candidatus Lernaella stagnicola]|nr:beta-galactosidase [Candidatus Lernaella stagnicola]
MKLNRFSQLLLLIMMALLAIAFSGCGDADDDDNDDQPDSDDDAVDDDTVDDDDTGDDDTIDDDSGDDDSGDDDSSDDDTGDDDTGDDDTVLPDAYDGMNPSGKMLAEILGVSSHMSRGTAYSWKREFEIEKLVEANMTMVRTDFHWSNIEPEDNVWNFDGLDTMTDLCLDAGLEVTAIFLNSPDWATPSGLNDDIDPVEYADYTGHLAEHYGDRIDNYEVWNEQNTSRFWKPEPNPEHYGTILKAAYTAVHENDPDATVIFGGLSGFEMKLFHEMGVWNFLYRVWEEHSDICDYFDAMSIHPYSFLQQPCPEFDLDLGFYHYPSMLVMVEQVRNILNIMGCPDKEIQFTEVGWPSLIINDDRQAAYLARSLQFAMKAGVAIYDWYTFWDGSGSASLPTEDYFGLFTYPEDTEETDPKPSYMALIGASEIVGDAHYAGDLGEALGWDNGDYAYVLASDADLWTVALWHDGSMIFQETQVTIPFPDDVAAQWVLYDQDGEQIDSGETDAGELVVTISGEVCYLQFGR